jgi:hypothetical protein
VVHLTFDGVDVEVYCCMTVHITSDEAVIKKISTKKILKVFLYIYVVNLHLVPRSFEL